MSDTPWEHQDRAIYTAAELAREFAGRLAKKEETMTPTTPEQVAEVASNVTEASTLSQLLSELRQMAGWRDKYFAEHERAERLAGPGSPGARFVELMNALERRFPKAAAPFSSEPPEWKYLAAIDATVQDAARWRAVRGQFRILSSGDDAEVVWWFEHEAQWAPVPATVDEAADSLIAEHSDA